MQTIIVHGSYFANNFGDTILVQEAIKLISEVSPEAQIFRACKGHKRESLEFRSKVWAGEAPTALVYAGGGYLGENAKSIYVKRAFWAVRNYFRHFYWVKRKNIDCKVLFLCVGYGPITVNWFRRLVVQRLNKADLIIFRDSESFRLYRQDGGNNKNVFNLNDLILLRYCANRCVSQKESGILGVHINGFTIEKFKLIISALKMDHAGNRIVFFCDANTKHIRKFRAICEREFSVDEATFKDYSGPENLFKTLQQLEYVITAKLHVGIVSISFGLKVLSIASHSKTTRLYKQLGLQDWCIDQRQAYFTDIRSSIDKLMSCTDVNIDVSELQENYNVLRIHLCKALN